MRAGIDHSRGRVRTRTMPRRLVSGILFLSLVLVPACRGNQKEDEAPEPIAATFLKIENRAYLDMTIYVYRNSQRLRLGQAIGNSTTKLLIPANLIFGSTALRFQADPIGGSRQSISQEISVSAGDEVSLIIPP